MVPVLIHGKLFAPFCNLQRLLDSIGAEQRSNEIYVIHTTEPFYKGFSTRQINRLFQRFKHLDKRDRGLLSKEDLLSIPEVNINPLGERLAEVMVEDYGSSHDEQSINFKEFVHILATFRSTRRSKVGGRSDITNASAICSKENKLRFLFNVSIKLLLILTARHVQLYDRNHDEKIDKKELVDILKMMVGGNIEESIVDNIASQTISELDQDGDRAITFDEFRQTLSRIDLESRMSMKFMC
ncbi:hypothetical protein ACOME3_010266 [Neoechinorhynchus agilis]